MNDETNGEIVRAIRDSIGSYLPALMENELINALRWGPVLNAANAATAAEREACAKVAERVDPPLSPDAANEVFAAAIRARSTPPAEPKHEPHLMSESDSEGWRCNGCGNTYKWVEEHCPRCCGTKIKCPARSVR